MNPDVNQMISQLNEMLKEKNMNINDIFCQIQSQNSNDNTAHTTDDKTGKTSTSEGQFTDFSQNVDHSSEILESVQKLFHSSQGNHSNQENDQTTSDETRGQSGFDFSNIDINTVLKLQRIMSKLNDHNDPKNKLLLSLKPFLKTSKKDKLDQYIQIMNMLKIANMIMRI